MAYFRTKIVHPPHACFAFDSNYGIGNPKLSRIEYLARVSIKSWDHPKTGSQVYKVYTKPNMFEIHSITICRY